MKKLFNYCRLCLKLLSRNLSTLLAFEIIYSVITVFLIYPILSFSIDKTMSLSGLTYLSNDNIIYYLSRPATIFIWLAVLLVSCLIVIFKIMSVTWYVHASYNQKDISIVQMFKLGGKCLLSRSKAELYWYFYIPCFSPLLFQVSPAWTQSLNLFRITYMKATFYLY